ncbi:MAG: SpoIIE family protein phosphatase [Spirochaetes bacterium]|jgi:serine phosphatase RsbU (regulator of sigma subunit)|nr:SpoIIE family protein phosphatase [Spirochaetota bacterium]
MKKRQVRQIRFGIRFKFTLILIAAITFVTAIISFAVFNQNENKIKAAMLRMAAITLKGSSESVENYLQSSNALKTAETKKLTAQQKTALINLKNESYKSMTKYFPSVIGKDRILDIPFLIEIDWTDINAGWDRSDQAFYWYFDRTTGQLFAEKGRRGRDDPLLKPSVLYHYMNNLDFTNHLLMTDILGKKEYEYLVKNLERDYIIAGMPFFKKKDSLSLYESYQKFSKSSITSSPVRLIYVVRLKKYILQSIDGKNYSLQDYISLNKVNRKDFKKQFIERILDNGFELDYLIRPGSIEKARIIYPFMINSFNSSHLNARQKTELYKEFTENLTATMNKSGSMQISLSEIKNIWGKIAVKYGLYPARGTDIRTFWKSFYDYISRNKFEIDTRFTLDQLAFISYKKDLAGILGIFLRRDYFFTEMEASRHEIINLIISVLIRALFIALFFPTFLIRSISNLADVALEIGKGNLDKKIEIKGSDELGRLADIFNIMTINLKKAQDQMLEKQRMENELKTAQEIQETLLPKEFPKMPRLDFAAYYSAQTESGGDYYDFIPLGGNSIGLAIADVSGHGVGSGLVMAMTRTLLHTYCDKTNNPKKIMEIMNEYLKENTASNYFVTMFYGVLDLDNLSLKYTSAGHNPALVIRNKKLIELTAGGIALGAVSNSVFSGLAETREIKLNPGDYLIQYTDGVDEAMDSSDNEYGLERFHQALITGCGKTPETMINGVVDSLNDFTGKIPQHDDITLFAIRIKS